ncbi:MAG: M48 family metalloprotease [Proteobacteria bacterium]|nr:M48 family metalloprotease [Pseudomonadota bacterium]
MKYLLKVLLSVLLIVNPYYALANELPELGDSSLSAVSPKEMNKMGTQFLKEIHDNLHLLRDPISQFYLETLGNRLVKNAHTNLKHFQWLLIESSEINAFAGPNGIMGVNTGLILDTDSESELAAVLAHEVSHVTQYHIYRSMEKSKQMMIPMIAGMIAIAAIGAASPNLGEGAMMAGMTGLQLSAVNFTRSQEWEADRIGMQTLYESGFDPNSMAKFFGKLQQAENYQMNYPAILLNHPVTPDRIGDSQNRASQFSRKEYHSSENYGLVRERIRVFTTNDLYSLLNFYKNKLTQNSSYHSDYLYGYALALFKNHENQKAINIIQDLIRQNPGNDIYAMTLANFYSDERLDAKALSILEKAALVHPNNYPLILEYGKTLIISGHNRQAVQVLRRASLNYRNQVAFKFLLARALWDSGHPAEAYLVHGEALAQMGAIPQAIQQIRHAKEMAGGDRNLRQHIESRLKELQNT